MCGVAELLHAMGAVVSGSDLNENVNTHRLALMGIKIFRGHHQENLGNADVLVYSSAISMLNPEMAEAKRRGIPLIQRAEALAEVMRLKRGVAIAGTHGKTTTTSFVSSIFAAADLNPTVFVGARLNFINSTAKLGTGDWVLAEADESDGSFHRLSPEIAIITNIDSDHMDYYKTFENLQRSYYEFALRLPFYGHLIACGDDQSIRQVFEHYPKRVSYYGFDTKNDFFIRGKLGLYEVFARSRTDESIEKIGAFELSVPGQHNALNALAAFLAGRFAGISSEVAALGLKSFSGVDRRFQFRGQTAAGAKIYDDYGHHPTEIRATLQAFREKFPDQKILAVFQPHRYSRTAHCWSEFMQAFGLASGVVITDIYSAGELAIDGISAERMAAEMIHDNCVYVPRSEDFAGTISKMIDEEQYEVAVFLGAGDIYKTAIDLTEITDAIIVAQPE